MKNNIPYAELHLHTHYSVLDGMSTAEEYCKRAKDLGIDTLAVTDHSTSAGHRDFLEACQNNNIKAILGVELHFAVDRFDRRSKAKRQDGEDSEMYYHLIALAKNDNGLKNLYEMEQKAWTESFYSKPLVDMDLLSEYHEDLIITGACVSGPAARNLMKDRDDYALEWAMRFKDLFKDDFYFEVMDHNDGISKNLNHRLLKMADDNGIKTVATSDCHHADPKDLWLQEALLILNTSPKKAADINMSEMDKMELLEKYNYLYPDRKMSFQDAGVHLSDAEEKHELFKKQGIDRLDIFHNTVEIAEKIGSN